MTPDYIIIVTHGTLCIQKSLLKTKRIGSEGETFFLTKGPYDQKKRKELWAQITLIANRNGSCRSFSSANSE